MPEKSILLVSPFPPSLGGVSVSVQRLYDVLIGRGYHAVKFNTNFENRRINRSKTLKFIKYFLLPVYLLFKNRFDVIHFHISGVFPKLYVSLWRSFFSRRTRFIITIHGQIGHLLSSRFGELSLQNFDRIICVKEGDLMNIPENLRSRAVEIPAFIPPVMQDESDDYLPDALKEFLKRDTFKMLINGLILNNARFTDLYGLKDSIILLEQLRDKGKNADLIMIILGFPYDEGSRRYLDSMKRYSIEKKLSGNIFWIENTQMEMWPLLKKVDVLLRPTKSDGDALSVRESLWLKIPAITSDVVPRPEGSVVYNANSVNDLLEKTISVIENYNYYVSRIGNSMTSFAPKIIALYEF